MRDSETRQRCTWRSARAQRWWLRGFSRELQCKWMELLSRHCQKIGLTAITGEFIDSNELISEFSSGLILCCENRSTLPHEDFIYRFRQVHPAAIVVAWIPDLDQRLRSIWLELGAQLLVQSHGELEQLVPHIVEKADSSYVEPSSTFARIQNMPPLNQLTPRRPNDRIHR